ncbi:MAG: cell wall hydrolase [Pseudomonadota bacterium]
MISTLASYLARVRPSDTLPPLPDAPAIPASMRALMGGIAVLAIAIPSWIVAVAPHPRPGPPPVVEAKRVIPKAELPPVEPVEIQNLAPGDARAFNATVPFSTAPNPAARAFRIFGAADSQERAVDCLAAAVYFEAGDDAVGERAVAQVVLNRVRHPAFPKTVCGVVFQGAERRTGCQFTFTCDGALARTPPPAAWSRAREIARMALNGEVYKPVGHATHYHTDWVVPYWSASLEKITEVHTHLFFRWAGWWGTPPAFNRSYTGTEPVIAQLARLSVAHGGVDADGLPIDPAAVVDALPDASLPQPLADDPNSFVVTLDRKMPAEALAALAIRTCGTRPYCKFLGWTSAARTPRRLPLAADQLASMSFSYLRDERQGYAKALWNCAEFPRPSPIQCMRRQMPPPAPTPSPTPGKAGAVPSAIPSPLPAMPEPLTGVRRKEPAPAPTGSKPPAVRFTLPAAAPSPKGE